MAAVRCMPCGERDFRSERCLHTFDPSSTPLDPDVTRSPERVAQWPSRFLVRKILAPLRWICRRPRGDSSVGPSSVASCFVQRPSSKAAPSHAPPPSRLTRRSSKEPLDSQHHCPPHFSPPRLPHSPTQPADSLSRTERTALHRSASARRAASRLAGH